MPDAAHTHVLFTFKLFLSSQGSVGRNGFISYDRPKNHVMFNKLK